MLKLSVLAFFIVIISGCASPPTHTVEATENTYLFINFVDEAKQMKCMYLFHIERSEENRICKPDKQGGIVIIPMPSGSYYLQRISDISSSIYLRQPEDLLILEKGKINYVGDFIYKPIDGKILFSIDISNDTIQNAVAMNQSIFKTNKNVFIAENLIPPKPIFVKPLIVDPNFKMRKTPYG